MDLVGGGDRELDRGRRVAGRGGGSVGEDARRLARNGRERRCRGELIARGGGPDSCVRLAGARERGRPGGDLLEQVAGAGVGRGGDVDVPDAPGVLVGAAFPVVDVDVSADDRAAGVAGVERAGCAERVGLDVRERLQRDHGGVDGDLVRGWSGGEVQPGGGDAVAVHGVPGRPVGGGDPSAGAGGFSTGCGRRRALLGGDAAEEHDGQRDQHEPAGRRE